MPAAAASSSDDVFNNCPFEDVYHPMFEALIIAVYACVFRLRPAREMDGAGEPRSDKRLLTT